MLALILHLALFDGMWMKADVPQDWLRSGLLFLQPLAINTKGWLQWSHQTVKTGLPSGLFPLHVDNNATTQLYDQRHIDLRAVWPTAHLLATDRGSPSRVGSRTTGTAAYLFSLEEITRLFLWMRPRGHKALMTRGWQNVKCLRAWINLKPLERVCLSSPSHMLLFFFSSLQFCIFYFAAIKKKFVFFLSRVHSCHLLLLDVIVLKSFWWW